MNYSNINHLHLLEDRGSRELKNGEPFESTESEVEEGNLAKTLDDNTSLGSSELSGLNLPEFIRNIFDPDLEGYFDKVVRRLALNYEPAAVSFMANASAALGGAKMLRINDGWTEKGCLWIALVGKSGSGKSPLLKSCGGAFLDSIEHKWSEESKAEKIEENENVADKKRLKIDGGTIESLLEFHSHNPFGISRTADEFLSITKGLNQFKNYGNDKEILLTLWNCSSSNYPTLKSPRYIPNVFVPLSGGIQTERLKELIKQESINDGFAARILFCYLESQKPLTFEEDEKLNESAAEVGKSMLNQIMQKLIDLREIPNETHMEKSAKKFLYDVGYELDQMALREEDAIFHGLKKLKTYIYRIGLLLHYIFEEDPDNQLLSLKTAEKTKELIELFKANMFIAYGLAEESIQETCRKIILKTLQEADGPMLAKDLKRKLERRIKAKEQTKLLTELEDEGKIYKGEKDGKADTYSLAEKS